MSNPERHPVSPVLAQSLWLAPLMDYPYPKQRLSFRHFTCGEGFEVKYRIGCFGPITGEVRHLPRWWQSIPSDDQILCAHCSRGPWLDPVHESLRLATALWVRLEGKFIGELSLLPQAEMQQRQTNRCRLLLALL